MKKRNWERIGNFLAGRGFYIVLFLCVAAIGISGYLLFGSSMGSGGSGKDAAVVKPTEIVITASPSTKGSAKSGKSAAASPSPAASAKVEDAKTTAETKTSLVWPLSGDTITAFSADKLVFNATMKDWRTHEGMDLKADVGTKVMAISAGTVDQIHDDELMGTTVVINHANNLISVYSNLAKLPTVSVGNKVQAGDVIGAVGTTAVAEKSIASHLHLELKKDGKPVDPAKVLPDR